MSNPKISIIIPAYNRPKELAECLSSIRNQTINSPSFAKEGVGGGYEIIIVDDGSDEPIGAIDGARVIRQENQGAPAARNRGFKESSGMYVIFCDADIVMKPDMLEKMSKALDENPKASYAYSSFKFGWKKFKLWEFSAEKLKEMPYIHTTSLMRREHFPGFDESLKRLQDWDLWLKMLAEGHSGTWINEVLFTVTSGGTISRWLPSFLAGRNAAYRLAISQVKRKHHLT